MKKGVLLLLALTVIMASTGIVGQAREINDNPTGDIPLDVRIGFDPTDPESELPTNPDNWIAVKVPDRIALVSNGSATPSHTTVLEVAHRVENRSAHAVTVSVEEFDLDASLVSNHFNTLELIAGATNVGLINNNTLLNLTRTALFTLNGTYENGVGNIIGGDVNSTFNFSGTLTPPTSGTVVNFTNGGTITLHFSSHGPSGDVPSSELPEAAVGCAQIGTPVNLWTDSTGIEWCVVAEEGDYAMLVSRRAHRLPAQDGLDEFQANANHSTNTFIPWPATTSGTGGPDIRERVNTWFKDSENVSSELRNSAVHATLPNLNDIPSEEEWNNRNADETALARPVTGSSSGLPFFLSPADLNVRLGRTASDRNAAMDNGISTSFYWLRSAGAGESGGTISIVFEGNLGFFLADISQSNNGVRLALWVRE